MARSKSALPNCGSGAPPRGTSPRHVENRPTIGVPHPVVVAIEPGGEPKPAVEVPAVGERCGLEARLLEFLRERRQARRDPPARVGGAVAIGVYAGQEGGMRGKGPGGGGERGLEDHAPVRESVQVGKLGRFAPERPQAPAAESVHGDQHDVAGPRAPEPPARQRESRQAGCQDGAEHCWQRVAAARSTTRVHASATPIEPASDSVRCSERSRDADGACLAHITRPIQHSM